MTGLREQAERLADMVVEIAGLDSRRGAVVDTLVGAELHLGRELLLVAVVEELAHRCAASPGSWDTSGELTRAAVDTAADHCRDRGPTGGIR
ncbi:MULTISPECIES: hypothetical protein [unclassified Nocardioides]|uniref:hypothetical protein n=1 Tax=unclassified Nocardioides TaxID=2615069 RepID=UPI000702E13F|nr:MULTISPECIES: hypothetical protein [unclassified Nocardioides]KRC53939.1 hypothetical protein ASE19_07615 [Nocardioides sp. Root79]KRC71275.1 hypothetical protein ASE20_10030 [Nocardioides sp. Root240]